MTPPGLLLRTLRHHRPGQLFHRARLLVRRHVASRLRRGTHMPGWWNEPPPSVRGSIPACLRQAGLPGEARLPQEVDLAGTPFVLRTTTDWAPASLDHGTRLERLHLHYFDYLSLFTPEDGKALILDWIASNPPYTPGYWRDNWNSYAISIRVVAWIRWLVDEAGNDPDSVSTVQQSLARQLRFLRRNLELDIGGNHLVRNIRALLWGAAYFEGSEARAWYRLASSHLAKELGTQILPDGFHFERSPAYHLQVFRDLLESYALLDDGPLKVRLGRRLDDMAQVAVDLIHPDGLPSLFKDGGLHLARPPEETVELYEELRTSRPEPRPTWRLTEGGLAAARGPAGLVVVSCGPIGADTLPAHAHGDVFSFEWSIGTHRVIVDQGVAEYHPGPLREQSRATRSHNTVTLDGGDQAEFWSSFRVGRRPNVTVDAWEGRSDGFYLAGHHDGYSDLAGGPIHERTFRVAPDHIRVGDRIVGGAGQVAEARLLLHPAVAAEPTPTGATLTFPDGVANLRVGFPVRIEDAVWMPDFGRSMATHRLVFSYGTAPCEGGFELVFEGWD